MTHPVSNTSYEQVNFRFRMKEYDLYKNVNFFCGRTKKSNYTPEIKYSPPYYISPIEIGLL